MSTISGASFITGAQGWLTPGLGAPPPMTESPGTQPPILTRSGRATWHRTGDTWPDSWIKTTLPKVWGDKSGRTKIDLINTQTKESQTQLGQSHKVKLNGKSWQMTGKEERTKTEMKNADKQGMVRDGVSGHPGHSRHQNTQRLDITDTGCSQHRHYKYLSHDENVRRRPSTNKNNEDLSDKFTHYMTSANRFFI